MGRTGGMGGSRASKITRRNWTTKYGDNWKQVSRDFREDKPKFCVRCGTSGSKDNPLQTDHVIPLSKGGRNIGANFRVYCESCNKARKRGKVKRARTR
jgi:5-methylcytosine-specific restriction endonuclease McrA